MQCKNTCVYGHPSEFILNSLVAMHSNFFWSMWTCWLPKKNLDKRTQTHENITYSGSSQVLTLNESCHLLIPFKDSPGVSYKQQAVLIWTKNISSSCHRARESTLHILLVTYCVSELLLRPVCLNLLQTETDLNSLFKKKSVVSQLPVTPSVPKRMQFWNNVMF